MRIASWNVLAPAYVRPDFYTGCDPHALAEPGRSRRVEQRLSALLAECDVVAIQEADTDLVARLAGRGVHVVWRQRPHHPDGVALLSARHQLHSSAGGQTTDGRRVWVAADVLGVLAVSTHVDWVDPAAGQAHPGAEQLREVLAAVAAPDCPPSPIVVGADLNAAWGSPVAAVLEGAGFVPACAGQPTASVGGRPVELDTLAARGARICGAASALPRQSGQAVWMPTMDEPSDHLPVVADVVPES